MQMKLSETLRNMRDQFRGYEIADGQVVISGEALSSLVETLGLAADAAAALEQALEEGERPRVHVRARPAGRVIPLPRRAHHARSRRFSPWRLRPDVPGHIDDDNGGGTA